MCCTNTDAASAARLHATHTDGVDKVVEESVGEQRLRQLPEVHLQRSSDHVDVLPLPVLQVHLLIWTHTDTSVRHLKEAPTFTLSHPAPHRSHITAPEGSSSPLTAKRSFCMMARFPLTLYNPSIHSPAGDDGRKTHQFLL